MAEEADSMQSGIVLLAQEIEVGGFGAERLVEPYRVDGREV